MRGKGKLIPAARRGALAFPKESKDMTQKFDPITLEILWRYLLSIRVASRELYGLTEEEVRVVEGQK